MTQQEVHCVLKQNRGELRLSLSAENVVETAAARDARGFNLLSIPEEYYQNPYPWFKLLRDHDPVHTNADGSVLLTRYEDIKQVWRDLTAIVDKSASFKKKFGDGPLLEHHTTTMLFRDPPDHDRLRAIVNPFFSQASIQSLSPFIIETVDRLVSETAERGEIDFVADFAFRLPIALICRILGLPLVDSERIQELGRRVLFPLNPAVSTDDIRLGHEATEAFKAYLLYHVQEARGRATLDPRSCVIEALVDAERSGVDISESELLHMCIVILNGGHETTTNLIAQSLNALLDDPESADEIRQKATLDGPAIEELIRYVTPLQLQGRRLTREVILRSGNGTLPSDTEVILCQASANRDDRVFAEGERLNLRRMSNPHLAFGAGVHVCIGRPLARLELAIALPRFLSRFKLIKRTEPVVFNRNARFRGISSLCIKTS